MHREVQKQVRIADAEGALSQAMEWMRHLLFTVRALLSGWHVDDSSPRLLIEDPLPQFPRIHKGVWTVMHPNQEKFFAEVRYCLANLVQLQQFLEDPVWHWLDEVMQTVSAAEN